jgi:arachidonate 5-lipoxygenase
LFQHISPDNPVFLPSDQQFTWILAKMWFNNADAAVHQALCHFGYTHLLMESACVSVHRHLSPVHPIFKLLAPHFLFLPAINARGLDQLWSPGGWVDKNTALGRDGMFDLIRRGIDDWRMDIHGTFPKELESRGVLDPKVLPNYGFRDDAMLLYKAIETYVGKIVRFYYDSLEKINNDIELQNWAKELSTPKEDGGAGLKGVPGNGKLRRTEDITTVCVSFIFTCSVVHSAINYPQYNEYGFPPNYPSLLNGRPPKDKSPRTEEDLISVLPNISSSLDVMSITRLFSEPAKKGLAEWEFQFQYDPPALKAVREFREELKRIADSITARNRERDIEVKYTYLMPSNVANAICI